MNILLTSPVASPKFIPRKKWAKNEIKQAADRHGFLINPLILNGDFLRQLFGKYNLKFKF